MGDCEDGTAVDEVVYACNELLSTLFWLMSDGERERGMREGSPPSQRGRVSLRRITVTITITITITITSHHDNPSSEHRPRPL